MTIKILTVDDEPDVRRLIEIKLKKAGFEVITAADGEEGVQMAIAELPDLILMDVMMPKMDGFTAVGRIREEQVDSVIIMLTAKGTEDDVMQGLVGGADDYITKPFAPRELVARVKVALIKAGRKADLPE